MPAVFLVALRTKDSSDISSEEFFVCSRSLRWPSIAISSIATNIQGYQFLGMMGSAYIYGLAQANLEINAVAGLWMAAFIFVPLYLKDRCITITQFIKKRLGETIGLIYSCANLFLFSTLGLGSALFWGAYAADMIFGDYLLFLGSTSTARIMTLIVFLGVFSAIYTYFGGLSAVVRTDIIQFFILTAGAIIVTILAINELGGWSKLYEVKETEKLMHLHLPADHDKLPWIGIFGMILLNINYWGANQSVLQRSLAAKSLREAQIGLMVGGILKYLMAILIVIPGIALAGILIDKPLADPDQAFPYIVRNLPVGLRGIIICSLFASLMSTVDSLFNSLATLWSIDIYKEYIRKDASDAQVVQAGRRTILFTLATGIAMGYVLLYVKMENPELAFTHVLNEFNYYVKSGIVVIISAAAFLFVKNKQLTIAAILSSVPLNILISKFTDINYFVRAAIVIVVCFSIIAIPSIIQSGVRAKKDCYESSSSGMTLFGLGMLASLALCHYIFS